MKALRYLALALRWACILPSGLLCLLVNAVVRLAWGKTSRWERGIWWVTLSPISWPMRTWYAPWAATTFGPIAVMIAPDYERNDEVMSHEAVHAEQFDAGSVAAFVVAVVFASLGHFVAAVLAWTFVAWLVYLGASIVAFSRGEKAYTGNVMEEGAYAVGEGHRK